MNYYFIQQVKSFFFGQYLASGLKISLGILLPSLIFALFDDLASGLLLSLGAFYVSIPDHPGPVIHRRNGMLVALLFIFLTAIITGMIQQHPWLIAIEIPLFCFAFGMLMVYGARASAAGTAALLMMVYLIHLDSSFLGFMEHAFLNLAGGIWYVLLSLSVSQIRPYRLAQQVLGEYILEVARYLRLRADFYGDKDSVEDLYQKLVTQQIVVNEQQDQVRQIAYSTRKRVSETMKSGRLVIMIFVDITDLFEQAMSTYQDYAVIRQKYAEYKILTAFRQLTHKVAIELDDLGYALIHNEKPRPLVNFDEDLKNIKNRLDDLEAQGVSVLVLKKILINIRRITRLLRDMYNYFQAEQLTFLSKTEEADLNRFISRQDFDWKIFKNNLSLDSVAFRYAIRLAFGCFLGYLISLYLPYGQHSYWILLTILVILKPDFSLTKEHNYGRLLGTVAGALSGTFILEFVQAEVVRLILLIIFMVLSFSFNYTKYVISVMFRTALILIMFSFIYETAHLDLTAERVLYTFIGSAIAFLTSYFILPSWESSQIKADLSDILKANLVYLQKIAARFGGKSIPMVDYKLALENVYVQTANLASAFQRMLNEPKSKQEGASYIDEFVVLNHILSSYLASLASSLEENQGKQTIDLDHLRRIRRTKHLLQEAIQVIDQKPFQIDMDLPEIPKETVLETSEALFIQEQLELIQKVSEDLKKISKTLSKLPN